MKKIICTTTLIAMLLLLSLNVRVDAMEPQPSEPQNSILDFLESQEVEDGTLTLELLQQISSWDELVNTALSISDSYSGIENKEDLYSIMLINGINKRDSIPIYHDEEYVSYAVGGISLGEINYDRLIEKSKAIIDTYNTSNELQLIWESKIINENFMQIGVSSTNIVDMSNPATEIGLLVVLKAGATYYESSWNDGSGRQGIAKEDMVVTVNGFAYFDESRTNIVESYYKPYDEIVGQRIDTSERRMVHVCTATTDLGWVYAEDVVMQ